MTETMISQAALLLVLSSSTIILGIADFSCDADRPIKGSDVMCKCVTPNSIEWQLNDVILSQCSNTGICSPQPAGYVFQTNTSNPDKEYSVTVQGFGYSSCTVFSCTDLITSVEKKITLSVAAFNSTSPSVFVEPGDFQNGKIEITTECLFKESDIMVEWYYVIEGCDTEVPFTPGARFQIPTDCADTCNGEAAVSLNIGFTHTEEGSQTVKFGLRVYHKENTTNVLDLQTSSKYKIKEMYDCPGLGNSTAVDSGVKCGCAWFGICCGSLLVVPFLIGIVLGCILICASCCCDCFYNGTGCKDCVNNYYCECKCCASTPCGACCNIGGLPYWYQVLWASIICIPIALGILLVWKCCKRTNPPGGHAQPDHAQPLQDRPVNFN